MGRTAAQSRGEWGLTGGPGLCYSVDFLFFSNGFKFELIKYGLLFLKKNQIKYGHVGIEIRNKFPNWSFSKFRTEFELKFREPN
jgi:hypothetical protein